MNTVLSVEGFKYVLPCEVLKVFCLLKLDIKVETLILKRLELILSELNLNQKLQGVEAAMMADVPNLNQV